LPDGIMDCRVKPGNDVLKNLARTSNQRRAQFCPAFKLPVMRGLDPHIYDEVRHANRY
jgi:hypothetical protein